MRDSFDVNLIKAGMSLVEVTQIVGEDGLGEWGARGVMGKPERCKAISFMDDTKCCFIWFDDNDIVTSKAYVDTR